MRNHPRTAFIVALAAVVLMAACAGGSGTPVVTLTASNDACAPAKTELDAGKTTFRIHNQGDQVTEVYVYAAGDRVVTERENIGPGTSADLTANLAAGTYELACKPGQTGEGIRATVTVTGKGGEARPTSSDVEVAFMAMDYGYSGLDALDLQAGQTVEFDMTNDGTVEHEFEVFGPDGTVLGEIGPTGVGKKGSVVLTLAVPGTYRFVCGIDDHETRGMSGTFTVT